MTRMQALLLVVPAIVLSACGEEPPYSVDYSQWIALDAESLAEAGIKDTYEELAPLVAAYGVRPSPVNEIFGDSNITYSVEHRGTIYIIYEEEMVIGESWGNATYALFAIVNSELEDTDYRFYAFYSGNDLGGMFMTPAEAEAAQATIEKRIEWPYLPTLEHPWFGQHH